MKYAAWSRGPEKSQVVAEFTFILFHSALVFGMRIQASRLSLVSLGPCVGRYMTCSACAHRNSAHPENPTEFYTPEKSGFKKHVAPSRHLTIHFSSSS